MSRRLPSPVPLSLADARRIWLRAQRLDVPEPFGAGPAATRAAVEHLGYVQTDTINVIERCHHHILFARIPQYRRDDLAHAQSVEKSVFEYWTHALSYVPTRDLAFFRRAMLAEHRTRSGWFRYVKSGDLRKVLGRIRRNGALTIRDIDDDVLIDKFHEWGSRKPSKHALQLAFYRGELVVSRREGMLKTYELASRHFGWEKPPKAATETEIAAYLLDRALRAQGIVSLESVCYLDAPRKPAIRRLVEERVRCGALVPVAIAGEAAAEHWAEPAALENGAEPRPGLVHILSPFDPLIVQRKRLKLFFGYEHRFEAYVPRAKRIFGYFALPVLIGDEIVAALDLKTDRERGKLLIQKWTWIAKGARAERRRQIEDALERFERFQLAR
jgi:uncharacterized protein YcaQ